MPHKPHRIPGMLKSKNPRQDFIQLNPFVLVVIVESLVTCVFTFLLPHFGHTIKIVSFLSVIFYAFFFFPFSSMIPEADKVVFGTESERLFLYFSSSSSVDFSS